MYMNCMVKSRHCIKRKVKRYKKGYILFIQLLGQQAHKARTADVLNIADIVDIVMDIVSIADIMNIANIADWIS